jgi:hypothetical protein
MPVVKQSGIQLEYSGADEQPLYINGTVKLRARVSPPHVNNRVWFIVQIGGGQWLRSQANRESANADAEQYSLSMDRPAGQVGLRYLAYVRRSGIIVPGGAETASPDADQNLRELIVNLDLPHSDTASGEEPNKNIEVGTTNEAVNIEPSGSLMMKADPPGPAARSALVELQTGGSLGSNDTPDSSESSSKSSPMPLILARSNLDALVGSDQPENVPRMVICLYPALQVGDRAWTIQGHLEAEKEIDFSLFTGCSVEVFFDRKTLSPSLEKPVDVMQLAVNRDVLVSGREMPGSLDTRPPAMEVVINKARLSTRLDESGKFEVLLKNDLELASPDLRFVVSALSGETLADKTFNFNSIKECVRFPVPNMKPIPQPADLPEAKTRRIKGRVIERDCQSLPSCLQILFFAHKPGQSTETVGADSPVFVARADSSGYFFGDAPNEQYEKAVAHIAGLTDEINIPLDDGYIAVPVLLVVDLPETGIAQATKEGCNCDVSLVPRAPSHADIVESPGTYSADLGTGGCIQFNTPNRAIEEFDFYSVVRTTEPEIRTIGKDVPREVKVGVQNIDADIAADAALRAVEIQASALIKEVEARAAAAEAEVTEADKIAKQREAEAETAVKAVPPEGTVIFGTVETTREDLLAEANRAQEVAVAARVAVDAAMVRAATLTKEVDSAKASAAANIAEANKAVAEAKANAEARARAKALADAQAKARALAGKAPGRLELDELNSVDWDSTPTFYEATTIALGHLLHFKQVWYADGYSLGDLLYSLPLAPGQKKLISVLDWERRETAQRAEDTFSREALDAALSHDRDLGEVVTGALTESSRGGSKSTSIGVGAGTGSAGNGSYQGFNFGALMGVSGGYGESNSQAWQDSNRNISSSSLQTLRDRTMQSASAIRSLRSSIVQSVTQGEAVRATTEVVANHNHCHALTIQYFEVLRHLKVTHELADVQECLFVPLPMSEFDDRQKVLRWRQTLQLYLQRPELRGGFDAARRVETQWTEVDYPTDRYADETIKSISGELQLTLMIPLPPFPERPKPRPEDTMAATADAIQKATNPTTSFLGILTAIATGGASLVVSEATKVAVDTTKAVTEGAHALAEDLYAQPTPQERYDKFQQEVMPGVAEGFVNQLDLYALLENGLQVHVAGADFTLVSQYQPGVPLLVTVRGQFPSIKRGDVTQLIIKSANGLPTGCRAIVNSATIRYRTAKFDHTFVDDRRVNDDIDLPKISASVNDLFQVNVRYIADGNGAMLFTPVDDWEQRNPKLEDVRLVGELIEHLNANLEFYHHAIWWTMDPNRRYMLLDGYHAPYANGRSVASVVENRLIGIVGNSLVMPVARGNHLDPRFPRGQNANLLDFYALASPVPPARVSLPTRGVFAEAVMGYCNACEQIDDSRFWRWEESPIDQPPSIEPLSTATRRTEPPNVQPTPFPTPIVSIQNVPNAPEPAGVRPLLEALGKEAFPDITGLAGTQANAAAAYQQALDTAFKFGKEASTLAQQAAMINAKDKALGAIDKAEDDGKISSDDAKQLRLSALRKMVGETSPDDKAATEAEVDQKKATTETIRKIPGETVETVETKDTKGTSTKINAKPAPKSQPSNTGIERVVRVFSNYPNSSVAVFGTYDFGLKNVLTKDRDSKSFSLRPGDTVGEIRTRLPSGAWTVEGRVQADIPTSTWDVPVKLIPGIDPFNFSVSEEIAGSVIPFDINGSINAKESSRVIDISLEPIIEENTVERELEITAGTEGSTEVNAQVKEAVQLEGNALIGKAVENTEVAFGGKISLTGKASAGNKVKISITYKRLKGFSKLKQQ